MFRSLGNALVAIIACLSLTNPVSAGTTHAVIVGVGQFADTQIQPRKFAEADAQGLYDVLVNAERLGAPVDNVRLFLSKEDDKRHAKPATRENILAAVKDVVAKAAKDDLVIVAMFGRGAVLADRTCFFTADATVKDRAKSALATADLEHELQAFKGEKLVAFLDVNYKGVDPGQEKMLEPNPLDLLRAFIVGEDKDKDKEDAPVPPGRVIFLGNANVSPAIDLDDHGLFAQVILDGLKGAADKNGYEPDGNITVDELDAYIDANLMPLARKAGKSNEEKQQGPFDWGGRINTFVLTRNPAALPKVNERLGKLPELKLSAERTNEGEKLLAKMPKLKADQDLRKLYQQLADSALTSEKFETARAENFAARKLSLEDAQGFAKKTMDGLLIIKSGYVKELELSQMTAWVVKGLYRRLDEKMPDEIKDKLDNIKDLRRARLEEVLADVRQRLGKREDLEGFKDVDLAMSQMMLSLDFPYTTYIDSESKKKSETEFLGRFTGIGIQIRRDLVRDGLLVVSPIKGSPAHKAGLLAGDLITEVITDMSANGKPMSERETVSTRGMKTEDAIKRILGNPNTKITVKVEREGTTEPILVDINRAQVNVETVLGTKRMEDDEWDFMLDPKDKIGYIRLTQFTHKSADDMEAAMRKLARDGVKGLVLDLRFNPGGLLDSARDITDIFVDDGLIVSIKMRTGESRKYGGKHEGSYLNFPMACLINGASASGSEIVAAALQDHQRAIIVGDRSFGKGSVQTIHPFRQTDAEIKMTTARFFGPHGKNLNKPSTSGSLDEEWGVRPDAGYEQKLDRKESSDLFERLRDVEIIPRRDIAAKEKPAFVDKQLEKGLEYLRSQMRTASAGPIKKAG